jgi:hypothetical protein
VRACGMVGIVLTDGRYVKHWRRDIRNLRGGRICGARLAMSSENRQRNRS